MASPLIDLCDLISTSVLTVDARCKALSGTYPDLNNAANTKEDESLLQDSEISRATSIALAAAAQLIATMQYPSRTILDMSFASSLTAALGVAAESSTAEIIREAGPQGCHVDEIAKKNGMDPITIGNNPPTTLLHSADDIIPARVLRPLATQHIFREVSPNVFAHNRISILLDTGKDSGEILAAPKDKHEGAEGYSALIQLNTDETFKAAAYIPDVILDKTQSEDELNTPLNRAFGSHIDLFTWYQKPENTVRFKRFGFAMDVTRKMSSPGSVLQGFKWSSLPQDTLIVDVGGGIGSTSLEIARGNPHLRFHIQDQPAVVPEGQKHWEHELPSSLTSGRVSFQAHDFFGPQPVKNAGIFLVRFVCHDWSDAYVFKILKNLRDAAQPTTKLVVIEYIIPLVCGEDESYKHIPGAVPAESPPKPLLANLGIVKMVPYLVDMQMMALLRGCERTFPHFWKLFKDAGWEIEEVHHPPGSLVEHLVAKPI
ncbi:O-methyltransferase [Mycena latifolia]|nr:O-methyltransferase [Mycena latifolia]